MTDLVWVEYECRNCRSLHRFTLKPEDINPHLPFPCRLERKLRSLFQNKEVQLGDPIVFRFNGREIVWKARGQIPYRRIWRLIKGEHLN
ncbi:MAG: hypothetical protein ACXQTQ_05595 [Candidatus Hecatellaceae archaeon]